MKRCRHILFGILVPLIMVGLVSLIAYISCGVVFTSNDCFEQYLPFFGAYYDVLTEGKSIFHSLTGSLGYDFWAVFAYYLVSPLNLIIVLFEKEYLIYVVNALIIIKIALCGGSFAAYIKSRFPSAGTGKIILFSTIYALSGYMVGYMWNVMWLDSLVLFPLVIMGLDMLMRDENPNWFMYTGFLGLSIIYCYFMGYMICIFIFLYFFTYRFKNVKDFFTKLVRIGLCSILAIGLSAIIIIPAYEALQSSIVSTESAPKWEFYGSFVDSFKTILIGYPQHGVSFEQENANLFITVFGVLLVGVYFAARNISKGDKIRNALILMVLILSFNLQPLNYVWHGMHMQNGIPNRFSFMVIFVMLTMGFQVASLKRTQINRGTLFIGWGILSTGLTVMAVLDRSIIINVVLTVLLSLAYVLILGFGRGKVRLNAIRAMAFIELLVTFCVGIFCSNGVLSGDYGYYMEDFQEINSKKPLGFYREKIDSTYNENEFYYENVMCYMTVEDFSPEIITEFMEFTRNVGHMSVINEGTYYGINGMGLFNSFHHYNLSAYYNKTGGAGGDNNSVYHGDNVFMDMLLGVKYYYVTSTECNSEAYQYIKSQGGVDVYENPYALSIGYRVPEGFLTAELTNNPFTSMNNISRSITGESVFYHNAFTYLGTDYEREASQYGYTVQVDGELLVQPDSGFIKKIVIKVDDETVYTGSCPEVIISAGVVEKGQQVVVETWYSKERYVDPSLTTVYAGTLNQKAFERVYDRISATQMMVTDYSDDYFTGTINLSETSKVLITVPVAKGWSVMVDGQETEYELYEKLFYVLELSEGEHEIHFEYETPGWRTGLIVSLASAGIYVIALTITLIVKGRKSKVQ